MRTVVSKMAYKYCTTCDKAGRGHIAVCGRRFGRGCMDKHAAGAPIILTMLSFVAFCELVKVNDSLH